MIEHWEEVEGKENDDLDPEVMMEAGGVGARMFKDYLGCLRGWRIPIVTTRSLNAIQGGGGPKMTFLGIEKFQNLAIWGLKVKRIMHTVQTIYFQLIHFRPMRSQQEPVHG